MDAGGAGETIAENIDETEETAEDSFITAGDQSQVGKVHLLPSQQFCY